LVAPLLAICDEEVEEAAFFTAVQMKEFEEQLHIVHEALRTQMPFALFTKVEVIRKKPFLSVGVTNRAVDAARYLIMGTAADVLREDKDVFELRIPNPPAHDGKHVPATIIIYLKRLWGSSQTTMLLVHYLRGLLVRYRQWYKPAHAEAAFEVMAECMSQAQEAFRDDRFGPFLAQEFSPSLLEKYSFRQAFEDVLKNFDVLDGSDVLRHVMDCQNVAAGAVYADVFTADEMENLLNRLIDTKNVALAHGVLMMAIYHTACHNRQVFLNASSRFRTHEDKFRNFLDKLEGFGKSPCVTEREELSDERLQLLSVQNTAHQLRTLMDKESQRLQHLCLQDAAEKVRTLMMQQLKPGFARCRSLEGLGRPSDIERHNVYASEVLEVPRGFVRSPSGCIYSPSGPMEADSGLIYSPPSGLIYSPPSGLMEADSEASAESKRKHADGPGAEAKTEVATDEYKKKRES
jgi:hypothetical protein